MIRLPDVFVLVVRYHIEGLEDLSDFDILYTIVLMDARRPALHGTQGVHDSTALL